MTANIWPDKLPSDESYVKTIYELNWRMTKQNKEETVDKISDILKQVSRDTLVNINNRFRLHKDCHDLVDNRLANWLEPVTYRATIYDHIAQTTFNCLSLMDAVRIFDPFQKELRR